MFLVARNKTEDPFADPKHDINNPLRYIPSNTATTIAVVFFGAVALALATRQFLGRWRARYMLSLVIGCFSAYPSALTGDLYPDVSLNSYDGWSRNAVSACASPGLGGFVHWRRLVSPIQRVHYVAHSC